MPCNSFSPHLSWLLKREAKQAAGSQLLHPALLDLGSFLPCSGLSVLPPLAAGARCGKHGALLAAAPGSWWRPQGKFPLPLGCFSHLGAGAPDPETSHARRFSGFNRQTLYKVILYTASHLITL